MVVLESYRLAMGVLYRMLDQYMESALQMMRTAFATQSNTLSCDNSYQQMMEW